MCTKISSLQALPSIDLGTRGNAAVNEDDEGGTKRLEWLKVRIYKQANVQDVPKDVIPQKFLHQPLDLSRNQFRLLQIWRGLDGRIEGRLQQFDFENTPEYCALSYTWGCLETCDVLINGGLLAVRINLYKFLEKLADYPVRSWNTHMYLWVDQICINQNVVNERNHQVNLMKVIYRGASEVLVWLGPDPHHGAAIRFVKHLIHLWPSDQPRWLDLTSRERDAFKDFFHANTYWKRLWIVQEMKLAREYTIIYGDSSLSKGEFLTFCKSVFGAKNIPSIIHWIVDEDVTSLYHALLETSDSRCTNPRDKIYGLQSLLREQHRIAVDYKKPVSSVFFEVAEVLLDIVSKGSLNQAEVLECIYLVGKGMDVIPGSIGSAQNFRDLVQCQPRGLGPMGHLVDYIADWDPEDGYDSSDFEDNRDYFYWWWGSKKSSTMLQIIELVRDSTQIGYAI